MIFRAFSFKFMRFLDNFCLFLKIFSFKIFAGIKFRGFRGDFCREIKSPRNLIPAKINPFKVSLSHHHQSTVNTILPSPPPNSCHHNHLPSQSYHHHHNNTVITPPQFDYRYPDPIHTPIIISTIKTKHHHHWKRPRGRYMPKWHTTMKRVFMYHFPTLLAWRKRRVKNDFWERTVPYLPLKQPHSIQCHVPKPTNWLHEGSMNY